jgi:hypothetical protein
MSKILRVHIGGEWSADDFGEFFYGIETAYSIAAGLGSVARPGQAGHWQQDDDIGLDVVQVRYGSDGHTDFSGIGQAVDAICDLLTRVVDLRNWRAERRAEVQRKQLQAAREFVDLVAKARAVGLSEAERQVLLREILQIGDTVLDAVDEGRIRGAELRPADPRRRTKKR